MWVVNWLTQPSLNLRPNSFVRRETVECDRKQLMALKDRTDTGHMSLSSHDYMWHKTNTCTSLYQLTWYVTDASVVTFPAACRRCCRCCHLPTLCCHSSCINKRQKVNKRWLINPHPRVVTCSLLTRSHKHFTTVTQSCQVGAVYLRTLSSKLCLFWWIVL